MKNSSKYVLILLCLVNYLNYIDRFILAALLSSIKADLALSDFQAGMLATGFMIPYVFAAPLWGWLGDRRPRNYILAFGTCLWSCATFATGLARGYIGVFASRFCLGLGESAFTTTSPAFVSDFFPHEKQGRVLAIFSTALPVGAALGYVFGGILGHNLGWRPAFFLVGFPGLILTFLIFRLKDPRKLEQVELHKKENQWTTLKTLIKQREYMIAVAGYCAYSYVIGGLAHWMPTVLERVYGLDSLKANLTFGGVAVGSGLLGTLTGGFLGDRFEKSIGNGHMRISAYSMLLSVPFLFFTYFSQTVSSFVFWLALTEFLFFVSTSPINVIFLSRVPDHLRSSGMAFAILACHILGDAISAPLIGWVSDVTGDLKLGILSALPMALVCALLWLFASLKYWRPRPWPQSALTLPRVQAHRGHWWQGPQENTLVSFKRAADLGYEMCELDVQLSSDGVPVVFHDYDLKRLGSGDARSVKNTSAADLQSKVSAPTLEAVLRAIPKMFNIEIKSNVSKDVGLEKAVSEVVKKCGAENRVLISSFNPVALRRISRLLPHCPMALLASGEVSSENKIYLRKLWLCGFSRAHMLNLEQKMLTPRRIESLKKRQVPIAAWTVNDLTSAKSLCELGVDSIITDQILPGDVNA